MILPNMDAVQEHIAYAKTLIHDNNLSIAKPHDRTFNRSSGFIEHIQGVARILGQDNGIDS